MNFSRCFCLAFIFLLGSCGQSPNQSAGPNQNTTHNPSKTNKANNKRATPILSQTKLPKASKAMSLIAGSQFVCAHLDNSQVKCWGMNNAGELNIHQARNAKNDIYDLSQAQFSQFGSGSFHSCGIVKTPPLEGIGLCFGKEGPWLDVPHEKIKELAVGSNYTCFIKQDDRLSCVGGSFLSLNRSEAIRINAPDFPRYGIDPISGAEQQDFSLKKFKKIKAATERICAQALDDNKVYCMGGNFKGAGQAIDAQVRDFQPGSELSTSFINMNGEYKVVGSIIKSPANRFKYNKFVPGGLLAAAGNIDDDGTVIPENTFIDWNGKIKKNILQFVIIGIGTIEGVSCVLNTNHKVKCFIRNKPQMSLKVIDDIPPEIAE